MSNSVGSVQITSVGELPSNMAVLIWGRAGVGKTTLACTAPGRKLIINFDPNGPASVAFRDDVDVLDYSKADANITGEFKRTDPFNLSKVLEPYGTVILDSLSSVQELAVKQGVNIAQALGIKSTIENPSPTAYGARGVLVVELVRSLLGVCGRMNKHLIFVGHEGAPRLDKDGNVLSFPIMLGGQVPTNVGIKLSEVWIMYDLGKAKTIAVRPTRQREIAKTRMFVTTGQPEFVWSYDPEDGDEGQTSMTIADWHRRWLDNNKRKIPLPK